MTFQPIASDSISSTHNDKNYVTENDKSNLFPLSLDHIDIDDTEFDIPPIANPPTLESILNAPDYDDDDEDIQHLTDHFLPNRSDLIDSSSISSQDSLAPSRSRVPLSLLHQKQQAETKSVHGDVFRHVLLKSISSQISSASNKVDAGQPTCLEFSSLIAVGMSRGLVLIFNNTQILKWCLGSTAVGAQYGAVSSLSFNIDSTRLLVGFARGQITMWNITNGKLLRTVTDAHPPGMAILHVRFTDDRTMAVSSDSGGSVFQLDFKRTLAVRTCESHCLFSGSKGEACVIEPLTSNQNIIDHPMKDVILVAIGTLSKMLLVVLKPQLRLHYVHPFLGDSSSLPLLSWQYVIIQVDSQRVVDPVLAFARGNQIHFAQVMGRGPEKIQITVLQEMTVAYKLLAITWINSRSMVLIESTERAHLIDVRSEEELQVLDLTYVQLAYGTSFYKSLATGGNVSEAMAFAGSKACYNSVATYNHQLLLLGTKGVHVITLRSWTERINSLLKQHQYKQALQLGLMFYEGKGKGIVGLSWNEEKRKKMVNEVMIKSMTQYIDVFMLSYNSLPSNGFLDNLEDDDEVVCQLEVIQTCITFCLLTDNVDFLFNFLYDKFSQNTVTKGLYLESLEAFILDDKLSNISPVVMRDMVEHYETHELLSNLESCISHIDIASFDLHNIISLCWAHNLHQGILHIYNRGMGEYVTPLLQLIDKLQEQLHKHQPSTQSLKLRNELGFKVLLYISCCLTGKAFPRGELSEEKAQTIREEVLLCITSSTATAPSSKAPSSTTSPLPSPSYPYLRTLIRFDAREFFNVLSIAFEDSGFTDVSKQRLVDILLLLMLENAVFNPSETGILFIFLARQMSKEKSVLEVKASLFEQVLESLCAPNDDSRHEERQQIFMELLKTGVLERFHGQDREVVRLVSMAEAAEFYRVVEVLHVKHRRFHLVLACYWRDAGRQRGIFNYVQEVVRDASVGVSEKALLRKEVLNGVEHFVEIDAVQTARMVVGGVLEGGVLKVVEKLQHQHKLLLKFLKGLFEYANTPQEPPNFTRRSSFTGETVSFKLEPILFERYLDLVCRFKHPCDQILEFLKHHLGSYVPESLLQVVAKYNMRRVMCYLHEVSGNVESAFSLHMELLGEGMDGENEKGVEEGVGRVLKFLHQYQSLFSPEQTNTFWFKLFDVILQKQVELNTKTENVPGAVNSEFLEKEDNENEINKMGKNDKDVNISEQTSLSIDFLKSMTSNIMTSAMPHLSPGSIIERLISSPAYAKGEFGELRGLLMSMMDTCNYEKVLMMASKDLAYRDLHQLMIQLIRVCRKSVFFHPSMNCSVCSEALFRRFSHSITPNPSNLSLNLNSNNTSNDSVLFFPCQHSYHFVCHLRISSDYECSEEDLSRFCFLCSNKKPIKAEKVKSEPLDQLEIDRILAEQSISSSLSTQPWVSSLSPSQYLSFKRLRKLQQFPSNMSVLNELKTSSSPKTTPLLSPYNKSNQHVRSSHAAYLSQKLAPPPLVLPS